MKSTKNIVVLTLAVLVLLGLAYYTTHRQQPTAPAQLGKPVLAGVDVNQVTGVQIARNGESLRITQSNGVWQVENAFGYPADFSKLRRSLLELHNLTISHVQRDFSPAPDATVTRVNLSDAQARTLAELQIVSRTTDGYAPGRYIIRDSQPDGWLVQSDLTEFSPEPRQWINREVVDLPARDVRRIDMVPDDGTPVTFAREDGKLRMLNLEDSELFDDAKAFGIESALSRLMFQNVADPALDPATTGLSTGAVFRVTSTLDVVYTVRIGSRVPEGGARYAAFSADLAPEAAETDDDPTDPDASDPAINRVQAEQDVRAFNNRHADWVYTLASHTADNMTQRRDALVKPASEPIPEEPEATELPDPETTVHPTAGPVPGEPDVASEAEADERPAEPETHEPPIEPEPAA